MTLPDGFYAVPDPDDESVMTRWRVKDGKWSPHPAKTWYGPERPVLAEAPDKPGTDAYIAWMRMHMELQIYWRRRVADAIEANPLTARWRFSESTAHCNSCGRPLTDGKSRTLGIGPDCFQRIPHDLLMAYLAEVNRARRTTTTTKEKPMSTDTYCPDCGEPVACLDCRACVECDSDSCLCGWSE